MLGSGVWQPLMAVMWLVLGVAVLVTDPPGMRIPGINISAGWAALVLAAYNAVRWWSLRSDRRRRAAAEIERHRRARRPVEPEAERNPDFIFDEPPPEKPQ
jgi:hypothetical protein